MFLPALEIDWIVARWLLSIFFFFFCPVIGGGGNAGGSGNAASASGPSPYPSPSKPTWAQILNSNPNTPSNSSAAAASATNPSTGGNTGGGGAVGHSPPSSSASSQHSTNANTAGNANIQTSGTTSTTRSISPSHVNSSNSSAFNFPGSRTGFLPNFYDQQPQQQQQQQPSQQSQMNWPLNFNQPSTWMLDDDSQRQSNLGGSSSQQSLDPNHHSSGGGDGTRFFLHFISEHASSSRFHRVPPLEPTVWRSLLMLCSLGFEQFDPASSSSEWGKPVATAGSSANGWSNFPQQPQQQQQQSLNNPSRSNTGGNNNAPSNQWPEMTNFYGGTSSTGAPFSLTQNTNDNPNNNRYYHVRRRDCQRSSADTQTEMLVLS